VNATNCNTTVWFNYGTSYGNLYYQTTKETTQYNGQYSASLSGLSCGTTYYYQAVAQNTYGLRYGQVLSFTTSPCYKSSYVAPKVNYVTTTKTVKVTKGLVGLEDDKNTKGECLCDESAYLALGIEALEAGTVPGKVANFKVTYKNLGKANLTNIVVRVVMPDEMTVFSSDKGQFVKGGKAVLVSASELDRDEKGSFVVTATVDSATNIGKQMIVNVYGNYTVPSMIKAGVPYSGEVTSYVLAQTVGDNQMNTNNGNTGDTSTNNWFPNNFLEWFVAIFVLIAFLLVLRFIIRSFTGASSGASH
jgi:hypothetical protein